MIRTLVVGGAGFIGSHLVESLLSSGREVHVLDNLRFCYPGNLSYAIQSYPDKFRFHSLDATSGLLSFLLGDRFDPFDEIYLMAGVVSTEDFVNHPTDAFLVSVLPLLDVFRYQYMLPNVKLLFASSSEVYGNPTVIPTPEDYLGNVDFRGPRSGYDEGKRSAESLISANMRERGGHCAVVRLFNTYGPRMRSNGRLVPSMVVSALQQGKIKVYGDGSNTRTLLYVRDCVEALERAMDLQSEKPINIGGDTMSTILDIAKFIARRVETLTGNQVGTLFDKPIPYDVQLRQPDISRARDLLNWSPATSLEEGVDLTIEYWRNKIRPFAVDFGYVSRPEGSVYYDN